MAHDMMQLDDTMGISGDESVVATADQTLVESSAGFYRLRSGRVIARRSIADTSEKQRPETKLKTRGRGVRKKKGKQPITTPDQKRQQQLQNAIQDGSSLVDHFQGIESPDLEIHDRQEHLLKLTKELVLQALFDQAPGLAFPVYSNSNPFNDDDIDDLVEAMQAYQSTLALQHNVILFPNTGKLLKAFTQDVLYIFSETKDRLRQLPGDDELWGTMVNSFQSKWSWKWRKGTFGEGSKTLRRLDMAKGYNWRLREPHFGKATTLRSLIGYFEAARTRYLSGINSADRPALPAHGDIDMLIPNDEAEPLRSLGNLPRPHDTDSSDDEHDGPSDSGAEADVEDNIQVAEESLLESDRSLIRALDDWMELSKQGERQGSIDYDMLSALNLGGGNKKAT
ncbi:hypothetical protein VP1G_05355 [Cytospora mali]|uniref:Uncharacterized protein n=1 Tax=Cytospora mali TaxID=578113 RepID=A0A194V2C5_CYTMA|nr:hypothetical protein VP1G_05355 [Valsa mali var. pyri (nom. inval.)]